MLMTTMGGKKNLRACGDLTVKATRNRPWPRKNKPIFMARGKIERANRKRVIRFESAE